MNIMSPTKTHVHVYRVSLWYAMLHQLTVYCLITPLTPLDGVRVTRSFVLCVCLVDRCFSFCTFSFDHCVVCSSSI